MINNREAMIRTDAELSVLKLAQLERVQFHGGGHLPSKQRKADARNDISSLACRIVTSSLFDISSAIVVYVRTIQAMLLLLFY